MSRTIYFQPIFVPDEKRFKRNLDSLNSFIIYCKKWNVNINCLFGGWGKKEYMDQIIDLLQDKSLPFNVVNISRFEKNYGKATVVNHLIEKANEKGLEYDFILTCDSDIMFKPDVPNFFERLTEVVTQTEGRGKFGMISLQQEANCCHLPMVYKNDLKYKSCFGVDEEVVWPNGKGGIAGGCIFVSRKAWEEVGGYRVMGVYAGDDAYLLIDLMDKGYTIQMFKTLSVIHPHDDDIEYQKWKVKVCQRDSGPTRNNIDDKINEADEFWRARE